MEHCIGTHDRRCELRHEVWCRSIRSANISGREDWRGCILQKQHPPHTLQDNRSRALRLHDHCQQTMSPFSVILFLESLQGSPYETLIKEVKSKIDRQVWTTKEGLPFRARSIASKVRNLIHSMTKMAAARKVVISALMPVDLSRARSTQNTSQAFGRDTMSQGGPQSATDPSSIRRNKKRPSNAIESTPAGSQVRRPMV